jgi:hypothetical protein
MSDDKWLERVRKLLALAEDPAATLAEAEAFTAKANELMARHSIDEALLAATQPDKKVKPEVRTIKTSAPFAREKRQLLGWIAQAFGCKSVLFSGNNGGSVSIVGFTSDIERAEILYTSLLVQQASALAREYIPYGVNKAAYKRSWLHGYAVAVYARLAAAERRVQNEAKTTPGTDLVLADRKTMVEATYAEMFPGIGKGRRRNLSGTGGQDGRAAGRRANLGGTSITAAGRERALAR